VNRQSRAKKPLPQKIADLESHLFLLRDHLMGLQQDTSHIKPIAAALRLLVCRSGRQKVEGLLFRRAGELHISDLVHLQVAGRVNPDHPLARSLQFVIVPITRAGHGDPRIEAGRHSLKGLVETYEAAFLRGKSLTYEYLIRAVAEQMGYAHEDEDLDYEIFDLEQISLNSWSPYQIALAMVADLVLEVGGRVMEKAESQLGYKRKPHSSNDGNVTLVIRMGLRTVLGGRAPVVKFRSHISDIDVLCEAGPLSLVFKITRHGKLVREVTARHPKNWPLATDAVFALAYCSRARQMHAITNGNAQDTGVNCDLGWVSADFVLEPVPPITDGSIYRQFALSYSRLLSEKECADILALPSDAHGVWEHDHEIDPHEPFKY
jgi:hypothetical protein